MEIIEGEKDEIIDGMVDEFFHDAIADICVNEYKQSGQFDVKFIEGLIPSVEERKKLLFPHLKRKLKGFGTLDEEEIISDFLCKEPKVKEKKIHHHHRDVSTQDEREKIKDDIARLLSEGKNDEVNAIIKGIKPQGKPWTLS